VAGIAAQHDDAVGQQDGFFNVVGDEEDGLGGHGLVGPQLQQFAAQVLGREHVERGEGLVHEEHFRLDDQGAGKADALLHAAGQLFGVGGLKAVQADRVEHLHAAFAALGGSTPRACSGASTFSSTVSQGKSAKLWKTMETLISASAMGFSCQ
jgi:hypothetical protein